MKPDVPDLDWYDKKVEEVAGFTPDEDTRAQVDNLYKYVLSDPDLSKKYIVGDSFPTTDGKAIRVWVFKK